MRSALVVRGIGGPHNVEVIRLCDVALRNLQALRNLEALRTLEPATGPVGRGYWPKHHDGPRRNSMYATLHRTVGATTDDPDSALRLHQIGGPVTLTVRLAPERPADPPRSRSAPTAASPNPPRSRPRRRS